jgi:hypothetical protein
LRLRARTVTPPSGDLADGTTFRELAMTRSFYVLSAIAALASIFIGRSVLIVPAAESGAVVQSTATPATGPAAPDAVTVAIDDLAAWPVAVSR